MAQDPTSAGERRQRSSPMLLFTRYWLPGGIAFVGIVLIAIGHGAYSDSTSAHSLESATGVALLLVAVIVWMISWMYRLSIRSNRDREQEERAREQFERTGRWPEDPEPGAR
jgi:protein-S-isoprenylcysteine O-methyltransferase Ste14